MASKRRIRVREAQNVQVALPQQCNVSRVALAADKLLADVDELAVILLTNALGNR
jgi:hypothetical protein